ncbi:FAD-NAD(P)-binding protein [Escherichia sp. MOD1-EC6819]|uniref:FAD-NAD(P)-binding protein n=1 Tax=Escherichia sp. MOD1-EC6819 TaxID=2093898 RepID=UPI0002BC6911|nr:FAD-NAD(P)-binding protein [Escherichia sp. MOD1-EC6819]HDJ8495500.1 FAD-NAD(P)-binding protein [Escherichia coli]
MKKIAIVGAGPTGIYTLFSLLQQPTPLSISIFEQADEAGVGMPYNDEENSKLMLANIASIEIPSIYCTYLEWLQKQDASHLQRYGVKKETLHDRQFLPRILLGEYFRDRFLRLVDQARQQKFEVAIYESCQVTDLQITNAGVILATNQDLHTETFDLAVIATGHVWPDEEEATRTYFPSPWSGLMEAKIDACNVGIMGTSLSGLDAAMAVAIQHGSFIEKDNQKISFQRDISSENLHITLMSRTGILPEADFYCPIPYEPLRIVTEQALNTEIEKGAEGLLDRVFKLIQQEINSADPDWSQRIALERLNVDTFAQTWFAERKQHDSFGWAEENLAEVEQHKRQKHTVPWRYVILRLHEAVQEIVPHLNEHDHKRFSKGLARVFIDNYAAIPSESIRRLLALREAGIIHILALGEDYEMENNETRTILKTADNSYSFDVFIDARGQRPLKVKDIPFPGLREQLQKTGEEIPDVGEDYTLQQPEEVRGRVAFGALPWLMHNRPFVQGLTACAEIGEAMAQAIVKPASRARRRLSVD